jgi:prefoldin beta subunit
MLMDQNIELLLSQIQTQNQILQNIVLQKQTLELQKKELDNALEEVEKSKDDLFRAIGPVLVKMTKAELKKDLEETKEQFDVKIATFEKQEKKISEQLKEAQAKIQEFINAGSKK